MNAVRNEVSSSQKLLQSRAELQHLVAESDEAEQMSSNFPRSKTMRMLISTPGIALLTATAAGVLIFRPTIAKRLIRTVPVASMLRTLALRFVSR